MLFRIHPFCKHYKKKKSVPGNEEEYNAFSIEKLVTLVGLKQLIGLIVIEFIIDIIIN